MLKSSLVIQTDIVKNLEESVNHSMEGATVDDRLLEEEYYGPLLDNIGIDENLGEEEKMASSLDQPRNKDVIIIMVSPTCSKKKAEQHWSFHHHKQKLAKE